MKLSDKIVRVLEQYPTLCLDGMIPCEHSESDTLGQERNLLLNDHNGEIAVAVAFLDGARVSDQLYPARTSYGLKHLVERLAGRSISNGAMIVALCIAGVPIKVQKDSPNVRFRLAKPWIETKVAETGLGDIAWT